jgi:hypothetical protein
MTALHSSVNWEAWAHARLLLGKISYFAYFVSIYEHWLYQVIYTWYSGIDFMSVKSILFIVHLLVKYMLVIS